jgi:hypothetical protein
MLQSFPAKCLDVSLSSVLKHLQSLFPPECEELRFTPTEKKTHRINY